MPLSPAKVSWKFPENWINEKHTVLGERLRPFCLWHRLLLEITDSPFLRGGRTGFVELYAAVCMCRMGFGEWLRARPLSRWEKWRLARLARRYDVETECRKFEAYMRDYFSPPAFWQKSSGSDGEGLPPETVAIAGQIIAVTGWEEERAWMLPLGKAYWYAAIFARVAGSDLKFVTETDEQFEILRKLRADYAKAKAERGGVERKG